MENKMTISEAIQEGYTHYGHASCFEGNGGSVYKLSGITNVDLEDDEYILCEKDTVGFQISDDLIHDLLADYIDCQEDVNDEDGTLRDFIKDVDFGPITETVNEKYSKLKYYKSSNIQLIADGQQ